MNGITVPMAIVDFIPVVLFFAAAVLLQRDLYNKMVKGAYALLATGSVMVLIGGLFKAGWKILYALSICDYPLLENSFFPMQGPGFLLVIVLPKMKASIATVAIMTYLNNWNEFIMAMTFLSSPTWKTLPFAILEFTRQYSSDYAIQFAVMTLSALPAIIIYICLNKHITKGVAMGAVKG